MLTAILLLIAFVQLLISVGIFLESRRRKDIAQRFFVLLSSVIFLWTTVNIVLLYVDEHANAGNIGYFNVVNRMGFVLGATSLLLVYVFSLVYPKIQKIKFIQKTIVGTSFILVAISAFSVVAGRFVIDDNELIYNPGPLSIVFAFFGSIVMAAIYIGNTAILKHTKDLLLRKQAITVLTGLTLTIVHALIFIIIIPATISDSPTIYAIGYFAPYYFMASTVYSLLRQKLFDFRLIVVRSLGYLFSIGIVVTVYALIYSLVVSYISDAAGLLANIGIFVIAILTYPYIKIFFDRFTNKLFYRDAYDTQEFINELNKGLVGNIELGILLRHTSYIIEKHLKCSFCLVGVRETDTEPMRVIGAKKTELGPKDIRYIRDQHSSIGQKLIVADDLSSRHIKLKKFLANRDISIVASLKGTSSVSDPATAYLILGPKKSGNIYGKQDLRIIEIIADELVIAVQNALRFEEIQGFAIKLQKEVNQATDKLKRTNEKLRSLDKTKDEFISMASHQLRTPLTSVKGYLSMILDGDAGPLKPNQKKLLSQAFVSTQRTTYLISDLLNISRIKTGRFIVETYNADLAIITEEEIEQFRDQAKSKNIKLDYKKPDSFPQVMLDEAKIRQVIANFIDNAIDYTPKGGRIEVKLGQISDAIYLKVIDDGIGVPLQQQKQIFTKFFRASNAKRVRPDGIGLGLFMVKKVVEGHGGAVLFETTEDKGSTFGFTLPTKSSKITSRNKTLSKSNRKT